MSILNTKATVPRFLIGALREVTARVFNQKNHSNARASAFMVLLRVLLSLWIATFSWGNLKYKLNLIPLTTSLRLRSPHIVLKRDRRLFLLEKAIIKHEYRKDSLLEILHNAQELYGYLDKDLLLYISKSLSLPPSHVYGVATFYNFFKLKKSGAHTVTFCLGTACFVKDAEQIVSAVEREFNVKRGETSADGKLSLFVTRCIGACALAPNIIVDDEVLGKATKEGSIEKMKSLLAGGKVEAG